MAIEYRLLLPVSISLQEVAERAFPDPAERPTGTGQSLSAEFRERYGFDVSISAGRNGYFDAISDTGPWLWDLDTYVSIMFRLDKFRDQDQAVTGMLTVVRRVLDSGTEDAAFAFNGDILLLLRVDGVLVKHRRSWWDSYAGADAAVPG